MQKNNPAFFAKLAIVIPVAGILILAAASGTTPRAHAYALGPTAPAANPGAAIGQGYNFSNSFQNLISSFTTFFNNIKSTNGSVSVTGGGSAGAPGVPSGVTVTVDWRSYVQSFDVWFYDATGIQIQGFTNFVADVFAWIVGALQGLAAWVAGIVTKSL